MSAAGELRIAVTLSQALGPATRKIHFCYFMGVELSRYFRSLCALTSEGESTEWNYCCAWCSLARGAFDYAPFTHLYIKIDDHYRRPNKSLQLLMTYNDPSLGYPWQMSDIQAGPFEKLIKHKIFIKRGHGETGDYFQRSGGREFFWQFTGSPAGFSHEWYLWGSVKNFTNITPRRIFTGLYRAALVITWQYHLLY